MRKWGEAGSVPPWLCPGSKCLLLLGCGCCQWPHQEKWEWEGASAQLEKLSWLFQGVHSPQQSPSLVPFTNTALPCDLSKRRRKICETELLPRAGTNSSFQGCLMSRPLAVSQRADATPVSSETCTFLRCQAAATPVEQYSTSVLCCSLHWGTGPCFCYRPLPLLGLPPLGLIFRKIPRALSAFS